MWKAFLKTLTVLAASRKFQVAILSALVWAGGKIGLKLDVSDLLPVVGPLWLYIFGVAIEDVGKAKAVVQADSLASMKKPAAAPAVIPADASGE